MLQVLLHNPYEYPDVGSVNDKLLSAGRMMLISLYPETFQMTAAVRAMPAQSRQCVLRSESALRSLQRYSSSNCLSECRQNLSAHLCGCSPFYYPNCGK
jgi:hypothetical protein